MRCHKFQVLPISHFGGQRATLGHWCEQKRHFTKALVQKIVEIAVRASGSLLSVDLPAFS